MAENGRKRTPGYKQTPVQQLPDRGNKMLVAVVYYKIDMIFIRIELIRGLDEGCYADWPINGRKTIT